MMVLLPVSWSTRAVTSFRWPACLFELGALVVAVTGKLIDAGRRQQAKSVVKAQCLR